MDPAPSPSPGHGQHLWDPDTLNFAVQELRREFPAAPLERIALSVSDAAKVFPPAVGRVALLQRARERLRG